LTTKRKTRRDVFAVVDETVGQPKLLRAPDEVRKPTDLADEDPLHHAVDRCKTLRKFAPELIEALEFNAARAQ
jgi:hypothetical protein